ncbi:MAG: amino acid permease [Deltaproteobacteria bacterium]|nr:amino acid permease [Deltaproteobacteria bacterium]
MVLKRQIGLATAVLVIVADMIGTGIFMTTGNVLGMTGSAPVVMALWIVGGCIAVAGALCYAELATTWPDVGGEYVYLKKTFGFLPAFLTGWVSLVVGFAAPVATGSLLLVQYVNRFLHAASVVPGQTMLLDDVWLQKTAAVMIIVFFGCLHIVGVKKGSYVQNVLTVIKIVIVTALIGLGLYAADFGNIGRLTATYSVPESGVSGFAVMGLALLVVMFAYSGWNGACYIAGEVRNPERNLPRAMLWGTLLTMCLYLLLNFVFLLAAPGQELMGRDEVAAIAAGFLFTPAVSNFLTLGIAVILLSAVSVQLMIGPRVCYAMAQDRMLFQWLAALHPRYGTPWLAIIFQMVLAIIYVLLGSAMTLVIYMGFALSVFPVMAVIGMMYMRFKQPGLPRPYRVPLYPYVPLLYIGLSVTMMAAALMTWTSTSLFSIGVLLAGIPVYFLWRFFVKQR